MRFCAFPFVDSAVRKMNEMNNFEKAQITNILLILYINLPSINDIQSLLQGIESLTLEVVNTYIL